MLRWYQHLPSQLCELKTFPTFLIAMLMLQGFVAASVAAFVRALGRHFCLYGLLKNLNSVL